MLTRSFFCTMGTNLDIKSNLENYMPSIFHLLNGNTLDWKNIDMKYEKLLNERKSKLASIKGNLQVEACLLDIITKIVTKDYSYYNLFKLMETVFKNLAETTNTKEKSLISSTIYHSLINFDKRYLNFIGELAMLNLTKIAGFELIDTEFPLDNSRDAKSVDFKLFKDNKYSLLEVVNIHVPETDELTDAIIERMLEQKIGGKIRTKRRNSKYSFSLAPIIWGDYQSIKKINRFYLENKVIFENTMYPCAFFSFSSKVSNESIIRFGNIEKMILHEG